jgi:3-deoxy-D-manno-octulosonic-acid transferase
LAVVRRSRLAGAWATPGKEAAVLLVDTTGELRAWFALADSVIMGKSFLGEGGQNPVEPILAGRPVVTGPHMQNFAALTARLVEVGGMCQVQDMAELEVTLRQWVSDADVRRKLARAGQQALRSHAGATQRTVDKLLEITGNRA